MQNLANTNDFSPILMNLSILGYYHLIFSMTVGKVAEAFTMGEPISVAIGRMVNPSSFWVYPLPSSDAQERIDRVIQLEAVGLSRIELLPF